MFPTSAGQQQVAIEQKLFLQAQQQYMIAQLHALQSYIALAQHQLKQKHDDNEGCSSKDKPLSSSEEVSANEGHDAKLPDPSISNCIYGGPKITFKEILKARNWPSCHPSTNFPIFYNGVALKTNMGHHVVGRSSRLGKRPFEEMSISIRKKGKV